MGIGDQPLRADTLEPGGEVGGLLDEDGRRIALKLGPSRSAFTEPFSLIPSRPIGDQVLREAIYRYASAVVAGKEHRYAAVTGVLQKNAPCVDGLAPGHRIVPNTLDLLPASVDAICRLDNRHMLVQGPPGAGKTFTSSHAIVELLSRGKRVAVSSNSHKAINNLLDSVEQVATERGVRSAE